MQTACVLVTGGAGFIGSELVRQLAGECAELRIVDSLVNGQRANVADVLGERVHLEVADVRDEAAMAALLRGVHVVYHLACLGVRHSIHAPWENHAVNAGATLSLLGQARAAGVRRFVYVSTSEVYGTARSVPMTEDHPTLPHTVYGASKLAGDCYAHAYWDTYRFPTVVVRPFNSYGPRSHHEGDSGEVIPRFLLRAMAGRPLVVFGDGGQTRDFTFVADTARGIRLAGTADALVGQTVNIGYGEEVTINALARLVGQALGRDVQVEHIEPRPGDVRRLFADPTKAREILGFHPRTHLIEGLQQLRTWYEAQSESPETLLAAEIVRNWQGDRGSDRGG